MNKRFLREDIATQKKTLSNEDKENASLSVFADLERMSLFRSAKNILCYWSLNDELGTHAFIQKWFQDKVIYLPVVNGAKVDLIQFTGLDKMRSGAYNILEPIGDVFSNLEAINLAIVPGVAFSDNGDRMGRGGGYYDRLLPQLVNAYKIGVGYQLQRRNPIPIEPHDVKLDQVLFG